MLVCRMKHFKISPLLFRRMYNSSNYNHHHSNNRKHEFEHSEYLKDRTRRRFQMALNERRIISERKKGPDNIRKLFTRPDRGENPYGTMFNRDQDYYEKKRAADFNSSLPEEKLERLHRKLSYLKKHKVKGRGRYLSMLQCRKTKYKDGVFMIPTQERTRYNHLSDVRILSSDIRALCLQRKLAVHLYRKGFNNYSQMQKKAIPVVRNGRNCIITGMTGSGKTFAYLIPLVNKILEDKSQQHSVYLIIAPSEILVDQLIEVVNSTFGELGIKAATVYEAMRFNSASIEHRYFDFNFVVGTVNSVYNKLGRHLLSVVDGLVLEEFDMLLAESMDTLEQLLSKGDLTTRVGRDNLQLIFVSATMMDEGSMMQLEESVPKLTVVGHQTHLIPTNIYYKFEKVELHLKNRALLEKLLPNIKAKKRVLVFANRASTCDFMVRYLMDELNYMADRSDQESGTEEQRRLKGEYGRYVSDYLKKSTMPVVPIFAHSKLTKLVKKFQEKDHLIAMATDVASRGIDFKNVDVVINYDFPRHITQFLHRCGRMSRCNIEASKEKREEFVNRRKHLMRRALERLNNPQGLEEMGEQTVTNTTKEASELKVRQIDERRACLSFITFRTEKYTADLIMNKLYFKVPIFRFPTYNLSAKEDPDNYMMDSGRMFGSMKRVREGGRRRGSSQLRSREEAFDRMERDEAAD